MENEQLTEPGCLSNSGDYSPHLSQRLRNLRYVSGRSGRNARGFNSLSRWYESNTTRSKNKEAAITKVARLISRRHGGDTSRSKDKEAAIKVARLESAVAKFEVHMMKNIPAIKDTFDGSEYTISLRIGA